MASSPYSDVFEDIYFSRENGLEETKHVFLNCNNFPESWIGRNHFTIAETGFGTGLNFLAVWALFEETAAPDAVLDYVSFELYPLTSDQIQTSLAHWSDAFGGRLEQLIMQYPLRIPGWHRIDFGRVRLTLVFDDVNEALPRLSVPRGVDAWFLDGFAPAKNPQMWTSTVFQNMARLSHSETTLSSFTAAGLAKDGLRAAGFHIEKVRGHGHKRDMIIGRYQGRDRPVAKPKPKSVAIIGAGLAGTACASVLRQRGVPHTIFEASDKIASGASGNDRGIFNPRMTAHRNSDADFYAGAYALAARILRGMDDIQYSGCGSLHLITSDEKRKRLESCVNHWRWNPDHMRLVDTAEASAIAGISVPYGAVYLPDSGQVSPHDLCHEWASGSDVVLNKHVGTDDLRNYDAVILACAAGVGAFMPFLPIHTVRGQIIEAEVSPQTAGLKTNLCFSGYIGAAENGRNVIGSTFQKWLETTDVREEDNADILTRLYEVMPLIPGQVTGARAALRCATSDRFPVIGPVPGQPNVYVSVAHGSHGIVSALAGAYLLADMIEEGICSLPQDSVNRLAPQRFIDRAARQGK